MSETVAFYCDKMPNCLWPGMGTYRCLQWGRPENKTPQWREWHDRRCSGNLVLLVLAERLGQPPAAADETYCPDHLENPDAHCADRFLAREREKAEVAHAQDAIDYCSGCDIGGQKAGPWHATNCRQYRPLGAGDGMGGGRLETGLDTIHKLPEGKRANSGAGDTQPLTKGPGGESGIPGRHPSDPPPEDEMTDGHGSWDSVSPSPDGPEQSGAGSGARGAAIARQSSDPVAQEIERLIQRVHDSCRCDCCSVAGYCCGKERCRDRQELDYGCRLLHESIDSLASLARRLSKENAALADQAFEANADAVKAHGERDEARRLHDAHCRVKCASPWRPR